MIKFPEICTDATVVIEEEPAFTICTLVTRPDQYRTMVDSFIGGGFTKERALYLYIDNSIRNEFDAYAGLNQMIGRSHTPYIILCHQDITLIKDGYAELIARLDELQSRDPAWAIAGNAGGTGRGTYAMHITSRDGKITRIGTLPAQVESLDENFIILKRITGMGLSRDLGGFHLYGTEFVIQARLRGYACYAIDFHLHHHGEGLMDKSFFECQAALETKYSKLFRPRYFQGVCRRVLLTPSRLQLAIQLFKSRRKMRSLQNEKK